MDAGGLKPADHSAGLLAGWLVVLRSGCLMPPCRASASGEPAIRAVRGEAAGFCEGTPPGHGCRICDGVAGGAGGRAPSDAARYARPGCAPANRGAAAPARYSRAPRALSHRATRPRESPRRTISAARAGDHDRS